MKSNSKDDPKATTGYRHFLGPDSDLNEIWCGCYITLCEPVYQFSALNYSFYPSYRTK